MLYDASIPEVSAANVADLNHCAALAFNEKKDGAFVLWKFDLGNSN